MKSVFIKAKPGWGTSDIDVIINKWLEDNQSIEIIDIKYECHLQKDNSKYGFGEKKPVYTALIFYNIIP